MPPASRSHVPWIVGGPLRLARSREWRWAGAGLVVVVLATIAFWTLPRFWKTAPVPAPPAMSVAIMSFAAPRGDADASRIADALARDLVTRLGRVEGVEGRVSVISGLSFPAGEMGAIGPRELGRKLDARYVVEGDVLHGSDGNTVNLRLVSTAKGAQVWSERGSFPDSDVTQESSASLYNLSNRLRQAIVSAEIRRIEGLPVAALSPRELVLRANVMSWDNPSLARLREARKLIDEALRLEPDLEPAMIAGAINAEALNDVDPQPDHDRIARDKEYFTDRAIHLEPSDPGAWHMRTDALVFLGRWDAALQASDERIRLAPGDPNSYVLRAQVMTSMGRPDEALTLIDRVFAMNPPNRGYPLQAACQAHLLAGQADQAIATCEKLGRRDVSWYVVMAAAYANHGDMEKAAAAKAELLKIVPGYTISQLRAKHYSDHPEYVKLAEQYWYAGLRKAGFREN
jgi:adenylate cyclase